MPYFRRGTFDSAIWSWVEHDYPTIPPWFEPGDICRRRIKTEHLTPVENCAIHPMAQ